MLIQIKLSVRIFFSFASISPQIKNNKKNEHKITLVKINIDIHTHTQVPHATNGLDIVGFRCGLFQGLK